MSNITYYLSKDMTARMKVILRGEETPYDFSQKAAEQLIKIREIEAEI
jgi:hypothetical protein